MFVFMYVNCIRLWYYSLPLSRTYLFVYFEMIISFDEVWGKGSRRIKVLDINTHIHTHTKKTFPMEKKGAYR